jgi:Uma2 family endonuclease
MIISNREDFSTEIEYPESDGQPMAESDEARDYLMYGTEVLGIYFQDQPDVYVSGNLFIYYEQGNPKAVVAPDVFVVKGVEKKKRRSYKTWEENNKTPDFVLEITSKSTAWEDQGSKKGIYALLDVREYFQYDPSGEYLDPPLKGFRLIEENYLPIEPALVSDASVCLFSEVLGLELRLLPTGEMSFFNPSTQEKLLSYQELAQARHQAEMAINQAIPKLLAMGLTVEQVADALGVSLEVVRKQTPA